MSAHLTMPALIVNSQFAALLTSGYKLRDGSVVHKRAECRGVRCMTDYRGACAIFCSRSYYQENEDHLIWYFAHLEKVRKVTPEYDKQIRAWCRMTHAWSYRLCGFIRITNAVAAAPLVDAACCGDRKAERELHRLALAATDYGGEWCGNVGVYLETEPLHATDTPTLAPSKAPLFSDCCAGCLGKPPHKAAACHVNFQTVRLDRAVVPRHVQKEVAPWPPQLRSRPRR